MHGVIDPEYLDVLFRNDNQSTSQVELLFANSGCEAAVTGDEVHVRIMGTMSVLPFRTGAIGLIYPYYHYLISTLILLKLVELSAIAPTQHTWTMLFSSKIPLDRYRQGDCTVSDLYPLLP